MLIRVVAIVGIRAPLIQVIIFAEILVIHVNMVPIPQEIHITFRDILFPHQSVRQAVAGHGRQAPLIGVIMI